MTTITTKKILYTVGIVLLVLLTFGLVLPALISSKSDLEVGVGFGILALFLIRCVLAVRDILNFKPQGRPKPLNNKEKK